MAFRKYQRAEREEILTPQQHQKVESHLHRYGATSVNDLTDEEREDLEIDDSDEL